MRVNGALWRNDTAKQDALRDSAIRQHMANIVWPYWVRLCPMALGERWKASHLLVPF